MPILTVRPLAAQAKGGIRGSRKSLTPIATLDADKETQAAILPHI
jgi:hypothetical protein